MFKFVLKSLYIKSIGMLKSVCYVLCGWIPLLYNAVVATPTVIKVLPWLFTIYALALPIQTVVQAYMFIRVYLYLHFNDGKAPEGSLEYWDGNHPSKSFVLSLVWHAPRSRGHVKACVFFKAVRGKGFFISLKTFLSAIWLFVLGFFVDIFWKTSVACGIWSARLREGDTATAGFLCELADAAVLDAAGIIKMYP